MKEFGSIQPEVEENQKDLPESEHEQKIITVLPTATRENMIVQEAIYDARENYRNAFNADYIGTVGFADYVEKRVDEIDKELTLKPPLSRKYPD